MARCYLMFEDVDIFGIEEAGGDEVPRFNISIDFGNGEAGEPSDDDKTPCQTMAKSFFDAATAMGDADLKRRMATRLLASRPKIWTPGQVN